MSATTLAPSIPTRPDPSCAGGRPTPLAWLLLHVVDAYRRWGSPRTGACPHRVCHGGRSCSAYGRDVLRRHGAWRGVRLLARRFRRCGDAGAMLSAAAAPGGRGTKKKREGLGTAATCCLAEAVLDFIPCSS